MIRYCKSGYLFWSTDLSYPIRFQVVWVVLYDILMAHDIWPLLLNELKSQYESAWAQFAKKMSMTSQLQTPCALLQHIDWQAFNITVNSCFSVLPAGEHCRPHILEKCSDFNQALIQFHSTKIILFDCWIWNQTLEGLPKHLGWGFHKNLLPTHNKMCFTS